MNIDRHVKYPLFLSDFNQTWIFSTDFQKNYSNYRISWKPVSWEQRCSMRTDRQTHKYIYRQTWSN